VIANEFPEAVVIATAAVHDRYAFEYAWRHHHQEALGTGDVRLAVAAHLLLNAVARLPGGGLEVALIEIGGRRWGVWADAKQGLLLAAGNSDFLPTF